MSKVANMAVMASSLVLCFSNMLLRYVLNDFGMVRAAPIVTGITFVFTFHICYFSTERFLYFRISSASFLILFLSPEIVCSKTPCGINNSYNTKKLHCSIICAYSLLRSCNLFRHYYFAIFRELTPKFFNDVQQ